MNSNLYLGTFYNRAADRQYRAIVTSDQLNAHLPKRAGTSFVKGGDVVLQNFSKIVSFEQVYDAPTKTVFTVYTLADGETASVPN